MVPSVVQVVLLLTCMHVWRLPSKAAGKPFNAQPSTSTLGGGVARRLMLQSGSDRSQDVNTTALADREGGGQSLEDQLFAKFGLQDQPEPAGSGSKKGRGKMASQPAGSEPANRDRHPSRRERHKVSLEVAEHEVLHTRRRSSHHDAGPPEKVLVSNALAADTKSNFSTSQSGRQAPLFLSPGCLKVLVPGWSKLASGEAHLPPAPECTIPDVTDIWKLPQLKLEASWRSDLPRKPTDITIVTQSTVNRYAPIP